MSTADAVAGGMRVLLFGGGLAALMLSQPAGSMPVEPVADPASVIIAQHDCSRTGYGPDITPSHAVVDTGSGPRYTSSGIAFKIAFESHPGIVFAFCI